MPIFALPIILMVDADTVEEAQKSIDEWSEEVDLGNDLPVGTDDMDVAPQCEYNDEGQRVLYLPPIEDVIDDIEDGDSDSDDDDNDDFNDGEDSF